MRYIITGGTGLVGRALSQALSQAGHEVQILTRLQNSKTRSQRVGGSSPVEGVEWTPTTIGPWKEVLDGADGVIHLSGKNLFESRWNRKIKEEIQSSRIDSTQTLVRAMGSVSRRPPVLVTASAIGYYGPHQDEILTEESPPGNDFLARLCVAWEAAAQRAESSTTRVVRVRTGVVLSTQGGALSHLMAPFKKGLGGHIGNGKQWFSWIHIEDLVRLFQWVLSHPEMSGPVNGTAPYPVPLGEFCQVLGKAMGHKSWCHVPGFMLRILLGEGAALLTTGQRILPERLQKEGFTFSYPTIEDALTALLQDGKKVEDLPMGGMMD